MHKMRKTLEGLCIDYTQGDTFGFDVTIGEGYESVRTIRLEIVRAGDEKDKIISKNFVAEDGIFNVQLTTVEANKLSVGDKYEYRLTFYKGSELITVISGTINVKWGA